MLALLFQGIYYAITGLWPILSMPLFVKVTGPKTDYWLVRTVGLLVFVSGGSFLVAFLQNNSSMPILLLAIGEAFSLFLIDVIYSLNGTIRMIYLVDAIAEATLMVWIVLSV
jgi:hypothetical protein